MTDAQYYETHKDDEDEWGEPEQAPVAPKRRLASMISIRLTPEEAQRVRQSAEAMGESLSQFTRKAALQRCRPRSHVVSDTFTIATAYHQSPLLRREVL